MEYSIIESPLEFEWDDGNITKNEKKHKVNFLECEEVFFNKPLLLLEDGKHLQLEQRYIALGKTNRDRKLFLVFTVRGKFIRVISARDMSKKEKIIYEKE